MKFLIKILTQILFFSLHLYAIELAEYSKRLSEVGTHPNSKCRKLLKELESYELVALELIEKSTPTLESLKGIYQRHEKNLHAWEIKFGPAFKEAKEMTTKYRFTTGANVESIYKDWHKKKNKLAQSKPKITLNELTNILDAHHLQAYKSELATLQFWYGSHGKHRKVMDLVAVGISPQVAVDLQESYSKDLKENKSKLRKGEIQKKLPTWTEYIKLSSERLSTSQETKL